jgi:hypothetical protein
MRDALAIICAKSDLSVARPAMVGSSEHGNINPRCPSSKYLGLLSLISNRGYSSCWIDVKPLGADGSRCGFFAQNLRCLDVA